MRISPLGDALEAGDHAQEGGLAAAGRADQGQELAVADLEVDALDDGSSGELLDHAAHPDIRHPTPLSLIA